MKILSTIFYSFFTVLLLGSAGLFLAPLLPIQNNIVMKIVESGSMEPHIMTGSLVIVRPASEYHLGDVITFKSRFADVPTTHRIANIREESGTLYFSTKGDANEDPDTDEITEKAIIGKVYAAVPYVGYILDFARQPLGFILLIVLPACLIILGEIEKIWKEIRNKPPRIKERTFKETEEKESKDAVQNSKNIRMIEIGHPIAVAPIVRHIQVVTVEDYLVRQKQSYELAASIGVVAVSIFVANMGFIGSTISYFNDTEPSVENKLQAGFLDFNVLADGDEYSFTGTELTDTNGDGALVSIVAPVAGSLDAEYKVSVEKTNEGSDLFCSAIIASAGLPASYNGPLLGLTADGVQFSDPWNIGFSLSPDITGYLESDECDVDIVYSASKAGGAEGEGYTDVEKTHLEFYAPVSETSETFKTESLLNLSENDNSTTTDTELDTSATTSEETAATSTAPVGEEQFIEEPETEETVSTTTEETAPEEQEETSDVA